LDEMSSNGDRRRLEVGIVGAGFGGVGMGIQLAQRGDCDFTIFERGATVGGVWRANSYPGAACDVPSHLYSFSFAPGHDWSSRYAPRGEILRYLEACVERFGLRPHLRLETEIVGAGFDPAEGRWTLRAEDGSEHAFDVLVTACGQLTRPAIPEIPGAGEFDGPSFHSAEWDHDVGLAGKRVAVVGTGASAIQFVPEIAPLAERVTIYQRSAPWIVPKADRPYSEWERRLFERFPLRVAASRLGFFSFLEGGTYGFTGHPWVLRPLQRVADKMRREELADPELRAKATPDYAMGCKRVLISNDWYPTLARPDVELLNGRVERITKSGVVGADGVEREADVIIYGTGFQTHNFVAPMEVTGLDGRSLDDVWSERPEAFLGTTITGFPNMFVLYGPNTNHGAGSVPYTLECQFRYVVDAVRRLREGGFRYLELRPEAQAEWRREMEERSAKTVWMSGGCTNWYVTADGVNTNNWPGPWLEYRLRTHRLNPGHYRVAV
jgi:cation diffusion facilitator CzcD-associated flavoprotein CzcO